MSKKRNQKNNQRIQAGNVQSRNDKSEERKLLPLIPVFVAGIPLCYILHSALNLTDAPNFTKWVMLLAILGTVLVTGYLFYQNKIKKEHLIYAIVVIGVILRVGYMLYTPCNVRSHDLSDIDLSAHGHASYLLHIIQLHSLPETNEWQFYQQPLFYLLGGLFSTVINAILGRSTEFDYVNAAKVVSCIASSITLLYVIPLSEEFGLKEKGKWIALSVTAFLPSVIYSSGMVCPDALTMMFYILTIYYSLIWQKKKSIGLTVLLAVLFGFAIQTKISCGLIALFTAALFVSNLLKWSYSKRPRDGWNIKYLKSPLGILSYYDYREKAGLLAKYALFLVIAFPLGLWYPIRNLVKFGQPLTYVPKLSVEGKLYTGNVSLMKRLFLIPVSNLFRTPFGDTYEDYNLPLFMVKSSLFGEWELLRDLPKLHLYIMIACVVLLSVFFLISLFWVFKKGNFATRFCTIITLSLLLSAALFYIKYPFGCSMDFRYYLILAPLCGMCIGFLSQECKNKWPQRIIGGICLTSAIFNTVFILKL